MDGSASRDEDPATFISSLRGNLFQVCFDLSNDLRTLVVCFAVNAVCKVYKEVVQEHECAVLWVFVPFSSSLYFSGLNGWVLPVSEGTRGWMSD